MRFIKLRDKTGAEMTIGTVVVIILALLVLVLLVLGFSTGWNNLWDKIRNLGPGGQANVDTIVQSCQIACTTSSQYEYCRIREVKFGKDAVDSAKGLFGDKIDSKGTGNLRCADLEGKGLGLEGCSIICEGCYQKKGGTCETDSIGTGCKSSQCTFNTKDSTCSINKDACKSLTKADCESDVNKGVCSWTSGITG